MKSPPAAVAFDMIGTVFPLEPLRGSFEGIGLPGHVLELWFTQVLRDGMALDAAGDYKSFEEVARARLESLLEASHAEAVASRADRLLRDFFELPAHPEAEPAFRRLRAAGIRILALTNGGAESTRKMLHHAALDEIVERVISIDEVGHWKPRPEVYLHAARIADVASGRLALIAAHAWDTQGAARAGLVTGFIARGARYPAVMTPPDVTADELTGVADALLKLS